MRYRPVRPMSPITSALACLIGHELRAGWRRENDGDTVRIWRGDRLVIEGTRAVVEEALGRLVAEFDRVMAA